MEESEKRRERLKAMRMEADAEAGHNTEAQSSLGAPPFLENPLIESPSVSFVQAEPRPRFDFYTDPMAAFSANKKNNNVSPQVSQPFNTPPRPMYTGSPAYHAQGNYNPAQGSPAYHAQGNYNPAAQGSPAYHAQDNYNPAQRSYQPRGINAIPLGIRGQTSPAGTPPGNAPNTWNSYFGTPNNYFRPSSPQMGNFASHGFPRGGGAASQYGQGSPQQGSGFRGSPYQGSGFRGSPHQGSGFRGSPHQGSGFRGSPHQGSGFRGSPHQGSGRGRGRGIHQGASAESRPDLFYRRSMVEDPWKPLKPVIWKPINPSPNSWLPKSISTKKAKHEEAPTNSTRKQSLAEYLAAAFDEAAGKEDVNDESGT